MDHKHIHNRYTEAVQKYVWSSWANEESQKNNALHVSVPSCFTSTWNACSMWSQSYLPVTAQTCEQQATVDCGWCLLCLLRLIKLPWLLKRARASIRVYTSLVKDVLSCKLREIQQLQLRLWPDINAMCSCIIMIVVQCYIQSHRSGPHWNMLPYA